MTTLMRRLVLVTFFAMALIVVGAVAAQAQSLVGETPAPGGVSFSIDPITLAQFVLASVLPLLVAIVTTKVTSSSRKSWYLAGLALLTSLLAEAIRAWQNGEVFDIGSALILGLPTFITSVGTYYGLWRKTVAPTLQANVGVKEKQPRLE